ncbi:MAG: hypothetical protein FJW30_17425 [Acidobacteria bacterium]|nr:hypothetical protein [Acidobacteriota bacterium]
MKKLIPILAVLIAGTASSFGAAYRNGDVYAGEVCWTAKNMTNFAGLGPTRPCAAAKNEGNAPDVIARTDVHREASFLASLAPARRGFLIPRTSEWEPSSQSYAESMSLSLTQPLSTASFEPIFVPYPPR